jgi:chemotaxis protein methyltransferase CheR
MQTPPAVKNRPVRSGDADPMGNFEFKFTQRDFSRIKSMILQRAGISLADHKQSMAYSRLTKRVRILGLDSFSDYLDILDKGESPEWEQFVNALTTNLTSFFREPHHFETLKRYLLSLSHKSSIHIWCCASSTGEEPYTLAITAMEAFGSLSPPVHITATDIDTQVLETARQGVYKMETVQSLDKELLKKYFLKGKGAQEGYARVKPALQQLISFKRLNLLEPDWPISGPFDAIFCRNVMIYFERDVQGQILQRFLPLMTRKGLLFAGHSENFSVARDAFELKGKTVYQAINHEHFANNSN